MLEIALCDDDQDFLLTFKGVLEQHLTRYDSELRFKQFSDGNLLLNSVRVNPDAYDIIFLDVEMPMLNGFATAKELRKMGYSNLLVFVTNNDNEASEGYFYKASGYIVKGTIRNALERNVELIMARLDSEFTRRTPILLKSLEKNGSHVDKAFFVNDILYFEVYRRGIILKTIDNGKYTLLPHPLGQYHEMIQTRSDKFEIIIRSILLNFRHVRSIADNCFVLTNGEKISMGASRTTIKASRDKHLNQLGRR